jgi:hypothetical protein
LWDALGAVTAFVMSMRRRTIDTSVDGLLISDLGQKLTWALGADFCFHLRHAEFANQMLWKATIRDHKKPYAGHPLQ